MYTVEIIEEQRVVRAATMAQALRIASHYKECAIVGENNTYYLKEGGQWVPCDDQHHYFVPEP